MTRALFRLKWYRVSKETSLLTLKYKMNLFGSIVHVVGWMSFAHVRRQVFFLGGGTSGIMSSGMVKWHPPYYFQYSWTLNKRKRQLLMPNHFNSPRWTLWFLRSVMYLTANMQFVWVFGKSVMVVYFFTNAIRISEGWLYLQSLYIVACQGSGVFSKPNTVRLA